MLDSNDLLNSMKKAGLDAVEASKPADFCFGKVTKEEPLTISVEQKLTLSTAQLVLTRNVTEFKIKITPIKWKTEEEDGHKHELKEEEKEIKVHNKLKVGEKVVLIRQKGGQKYLVLDRVVDA